MQTRKYILSGFLIIALLSAGLPSFSPEDASRDSFVDLRDAILYVKHFAGTAQAPEMFSERFGKLISTLRVVAGCQTHIQPPDHSTSASAPFLIDFTYLISSSDILPELKDCTRIFPQPYTFSSIDTPPYTPPPRRSMA